MTDDVAKIRADLLEVKARASELSGDVDRAKKIVGAQADQIKVLEAKAEKADAVAEQLKAANAKVTALESQLRTADAVAATAKEAVAAAKQISDALSKLATL